MSSRRDVSGHNNKNAGWEAGVSVLLTSRFYTIRLYRAQASTGRMTMVMMMEVVAAAYHGMRILAWCPATVKR